MLTNAHIMTILPVVNLDEARRFYGETLGLRESGATSEGSVIFEAGDGTDLELMPSAEPCQADHTALTFEVDDVEKEVSELESRGVKFEDYDLPNLKTDNHVAFIGQEKAAWFKDPAGNILCLHQELS